MSTTAFISSPRRSGHPDACLTLSPDGELSTHTLGGVGAQESPPHIVVAPSDVTAACWSPDGGCIAFARTGATLSIVEPGQTSALLDCWPLPAELPDFEGVVPHVDSLAWLPDATPASSGPASQLRGTLLACTTLPSDTGDESDAAPLLALRWSASGDTTPAVFVSSQAILGVSGQACGPSTGPYLRVAHLPAWRLAVLSHRKANTEHIRLLGIPPAAAADMAAPTEMEVLEDREKPSVKSTSSGDDNYVCGLATCAVRVTGDASRRVQCPNRREPDKEGGLLPQGPLLCVATTDGRLWVYASGTYDPETYPPHELTTPAELPAAPPAATAEPPPVPPPTPRAPEETAAPPPPPPTPTPVPPPLLPPPSLPPPAFAVAEQGAVTPALCAAPTPPPMFQTPPAFPPPAPPALPQPPATALPAFMPAAASTSPFKLGAALSLDTWAAKTAVPPAPGRDAPAAAAAPAPVPPPKAEPEPVVVPATPPPPVKSGPDPLKFKANMPSPSPPAPPAHAKQAPGPVTHEGGLFAVSADMKDTIAEVGALASDIEALISKCRLGHDSAPFTSASVDGLVSQTDGLKEAVASLGTDLAACRTAFAALRSAHHEDERLCAELRDVWSLRENGAEEGGGGGDVSDDGDWPSDALPPRCRGASRQAGRLDPSLEALRSTLWRQMMGVTTRLNDLETSMDALQSAHRAAANPGGAAALLTAYVRSAEDIMERADAAAAELDDLLERMAQLEVQISSPMAASEGEDVGEDISGTPLVRGVGGDANGAASFAQLSLGLPRTPLSGQAYGSAQRGATGEQVRRALLRSVGNTPRRVAVTPTGAATEEGPSTPRVAPLPPQPPRMAPLSPTLVAPPPTPAAPSPPPAPAQAPKQAEVPVAVPPPPEKRSLSPSLPSLGALGGSLGGFERVAQAAAPPPPFAAAPTPVAFPAAAPPAPPATAVPPLATVLPSMGSPKRRVHSTSHIEQEEPRVHKGFGQAPFPLQPAAPPLTPPAAPAVPAIVPSGLQWGAAAQPGAASAALAQLGAVPKAIREEAKTSPGGTTPPAAPAWSFPMVVEPPKAAASSEEAKPAPTAAAATPAQGGFEWPTAPVAGPKSPFAAVAAPDAKNSGSAELKSAAPGEPLAASAPAPSVPEAKPAAAAPPTLSAPPAAEAKTSPPMPSSPDAGAAAPGLDFGFGKGFSSLGFGAAPAATTPATPAESPFSKGLNLGALPQAASAPSSPFGAATGLGGGSMFGQPQAAAAPLFPALSAPSAIGLGGGAQAGAPPASQPAASPFGTPSLPGMFGGVAATAPALAMPRPMGMSAGFGQAASPGFSQPSVMTAALPAFGQASTLSGVSSPGGGAAVAPVASSNAFSSYARAPASPFAQLAGQGTGFGGAGASSPFAALAQQQQQQQPQQQGGAFGGFGQQQAPPQGGFGFGQNAPQGGGAFGAPAAQGFGAQPGFGAAAQPTQPRPNLSSAGGDFSQMRR